MAERSEEEKYEFLRTHMVAVQLSLAEMASLRAAAMTLLKHRPEGSNDEMGDMLESAGKKLEMAVDVDAALYNIGEQLGRDGGSKLDS